MCNHSHILLTLASGLLKAPGRIVQEGKGLIHSSLIVAACLKLAAVSLDLKMPLVSIQFTILSHVLKHIGDSSSSSFWKKTVIKVSFNL